MVGNEKRVEIVLVAVERLVAAGERHVYGILTVFQPALFQYDMLAAPFGTPLLAVHCHHTAILSVGSLKIELQVVAAFLIRKLDDGRACHLFFPRSGNPELQVVTQIADCRPPLLGELLAHSRFYLHGTCHHRTEQRHTCNDKFFHRIPFCIQTSFAKASVTSA